MCLSTVFGSLVAALVISTLLGGLTYPAVCMPAFGRWRSCVPCHAPSLETVSASCTLRHELMHVRCLTMVNGLVDWRVFCDELSSEYNVVQAVAEIASWHSSSCG